MTSPAVLPAGATVSAVLFPLSLQILQTANGCPALGGTVAFFDAGTTNARPVYQDASLTQAYASPVPVDGFGRVPPIFVGAGAYRVVLQDYSGSQIGAIDDVPGGTVTLPDNAAAAGSFTTGDLKPAYAATQQDGFVIANGLTIGDVNSPATSRANADCQSLFLALWNASKGLPVSPSRGVSATADWAAEKTIALPDLRGRGLRGCDGMGSGALGGVITSASAPDAVAGSAPTAAAVDVLGSTLGAELVTLSVAQLPQVTPTVTVDQGVASPGLHTHSAATGNAGGHGHTVADGGHSHTTNLTVSGGNTGGLQSATSANVAAQYSGGQLYATSIVATGVTVVPVGDHSHPASVDNGQPGGSHTHVASCAAFGGGGAHLNMPPDVLIYWHIKL